MQTMQDIQAARVAVNPVDLSQNLFLQEVQKFEDLMTQWVQTEKDKDRRDAGKTDEEIGNFISYVMLTPVPTPRMMEARVALMPHIADFLKRQQASARLDGATVETWLRAVVAAWRNLVRDLFPQRFCKELNAVRGELAI